MVNSLLSDLDLPILGLPLLLWIVAIVTSKPSKEHPLSQFDWWVSQWFLFNGTIIHILLDGLVGMVGRVPFLHSKYCELDKRYCIREESVMVISALELVVMGPLCLFLYYAIQTNKSFRHPLQILVSTIQATGCIIFTGAEILGGLKHIPSDLDFTFTLDKIVYFWIFFVFANILWTCLPAYLIMRSWKRIVSIHKRKLH